MQQTDPTPEEIRQRCLEIQREWDAWTRYARSGYRDRDALMEALDEGCHAAIEAVRETSFSGAGGRHPTPVFPAQKNIA